MTAVQRNNHKSTRKKFFILKNTTYSITVLKPSSKAIHIQQGGLGRPYRTKALFVIVRRKFVVLISKFN